MDQKIGKEDEFNPFATSDVYMRQLYISTVYNDTLVAKGLRTRREWVSILGEW